jgi:hypothetical protein
MPKLFKSKRKKKNRENFDTVSIQAVSGFMIIIIFSALTDHRRTAELKRRKLDYNFLQVVWIATKKK